MTDANRDNWSADGENADRRMEDLLAVCVAEDVAGFAADEIFEVVPLGACFRPMMMIHNTGRILTFWKDRRVSLNQGMMLMYKQRICQAIGAEPFFSLRLG